MGSDCFSNSVQSQYGDVLKKEDIEKLKNSWPKVKYFKVKNIFEKFSSPHPQFQDIRCLDFDKFCDIFVYFSRYTQKEKKRIYDFFDFYSQGYIDWNSFYSTISLCYFGQQRILSIIMFIIFDQFLEKNLSKHQIKNLLTLNKQYLYQENYCDEEQEEQFIECLFGEKQNIQIQAWTQKSPLYIDYSHYRKFFTIFKEQLLQRQLVKQYNEWNNLLNYEKYVSYLVNFKWFERWKSYVQMEYGQNIFMDEKNPVTLKTLKSIKTKKGIHSKTNQSIKSLKSSKKCLLNENVRQRMIEIKNPTNNVKNIDLIPNHFGDRPQQILNYVLEGQFQEVLRPGLLQNRDYVFVSEKIWKFFKSIYGANPQLRRTGPDSIQLYPRAIKVYNSIYNQDIAFSSQKLREVSAYLTIEDILIRLQIPQSRLSSVKLFYRTLSMEKWQQIKKLSEYLIEKTSDILIFFVILEGQKADVFQNKFLKITKHINEISLGDQIIYEDSASKQSKTGYFMGKNSENKFKIHLAGESYINNFYLTEAQFYKKCYLKIQNKNKNLQQDKQFKFLRGITEIKSLGLITSTIIQFLNHEDLRKCLDKFIQQNEKAVQQPKCLVSTLGYILNKLKNGKRVKSKKIMTMVQLFLSNYIDFDMSMTETFLQEFISKIHKNLNQLNLFDNFQNVYSIGGQGQCQSCELAFDQNENMMHYLSIPLPQTYQLFYEVIVVKFCELFTYSDLKRYSFSLRKGATLKQYKQKFEKVANFENKNYIIAQINGFEIIKHFSQTRDHSKLEEICLREDDKIYVFELCTNFSKFVKNHYSFTQKDNQLISKKNINNNQLVDCNHPEKGWIIGKVISQTENIYSKTSQIVVEHIHQGDTQKRSYEVKEKNLAFYPSQSAANGCIFHLKILQRFFNQTNNEMQLCNLPLLVPLTTWMRLKQFSYYVYLQVQKFIISQNRFDIASQKKKTNKNSFYKFQKYLNGSECPYHLNIVTFDGRCIVCLKFVKSVVFKSENDKYCPGCSISQAEPISWYISMKQIMVCVDWKNRLNYCTANIRDHESYSEMQLKKQKNLISIDKCIFNYYDKTKKRVTIYDSQKQEGLPKILIVNLQRLVYEQGFKKILSRKISFEEQKIQIKDQQYELIGITTINSELNSYQYNTKYKTYIKSDVEGQWIEYDGQKSRILKSAQVKKKCGLVFYYKKYQNQRNFVEKKKKKIIKSEDYIININGEGLKEFIERNRNEEVLKCIFEPDHKAD